MSDELIISASGIRGIVGEALNPEVVARYGAAFGTYLAQSRSEGPGSGRVLVARDSRLSGGVLSGAAAAGLRGTGWEIRDAGVVPTPTALLAIQDDETARGGLVITASHNPPEWNGLKLAGADGLFLEPEAGREVQRLFGSGIRYRPWDGLGGGEELPGAIEHHLDRIFALPLVEVEAIREAGFTVALDAVGGAGGPILSRLLRHLECELVGMNLEPDGRFPRDPEPRPENLGALGELVREHGADLGMAVDPDSDRLALVSETGEAIGEEWTLAFVAEYVLSREPGPVVTNLSTSLRLADAVESAGQRLHRSPVGEANVARRMQQVGAVIGGEGNGGVMLPDLHLTRDAPLAAALLLSFLAERRESVGELVADRPAYHMAKHRAPRPEADDLSGLYEALEASASPGAEADRQDGLRLEWSEPRCWVHVRPSGTEPILRVIAEARQEERARELAEWALDVVKEEGSRTG